MEIKGDTLNVSQSDRDDKGRQIDPEERAAERVITTTTPIGLSNGQSVEQYTQGTASGIRDATINAVGTALEFASGYSGRCRLCKHFDRVTFMRWKQEAQLSSDPGKRRELNYLRGKLLGDGYAQIIDEHAAADGDLDVEHALNEFGYCAAMAELCGDPNFFVWPDAGCPQEDPRGLPIPSQFVPRDADAARESVGGYDAILKAAQGGAPKRRTEKVELIDYSKK